MRTAVLLLAAAAAPVLAEPIVLVADPEPVVTVRIRESELPVRVALGFQEALLLNAGPAIETGIKPFPIVGKMRFSNALLPGGSALFRFNRISVGVAGAKKRKIPTAWVDPDITDRQTGVLSIFAFEGDRIVWERRGAPAPTATFELARRGSGSPHAEARIGAEKIRVTLAPDSPVTIMNARAAAALEAEGLVRRASRVGLWSPIPRTRLPYQEMTPRPGATLLGLPLLRPAARISEAQAREIDARAEAGTSTEDDDADTILVKGEREGGRRSRSPWILVGADVLDRCATIELDRPGRRWVLNCAF
ncbi:MAG: hypothetical protein SNJ63_00120 [Sphingomonadaceae bacterium]